MATKKLTMVEFERFFTLLLKETVQLTDEELGELVAAKDQLADKLNILDRRVRWGLEEIKRYRARKKELVQRSTEELQKMSQRFCESRAAAIESDDDFYDPGGDSLYEPPSIDSDEHIVYELLKERGKA